MKSHLNTCLILALTLLFSACKDSFLEVPDKTQLLRQAYVVDLKTMGHFVNGIYYNLAFAMYRDYHMAYPELIADNLKPISPSAPFTAQYTWNQIASNYSGAQISPFETNANGLWTNGYRIIKSCNFVIEDIAGYRDEDPQLADRLKGEALGIRALLHHELLKAFAQPYGFSMDGMHPGIPYSTSMDISTPVTRQPVAEVYNAIITDLEAAAGLLPAQGMPATRFSRNAANALLARMYLGSGAYELAAEKAGQVCTQVPILGVADYPSKLFTGDNPEAIFQLQPSDPAATGSAGQYYTGFIGQRFALPNLFFAATDDMAEVLQEANNDIRRNWVYPEGENWLIRKFPVDVIPGFGNVNASHYIDLLRSSDMCLIAAEAYAQLGQTGNARDFLDAIRQRADPSAPATQAAGEELLEAIYRERRKEFCFEGTRMYDLLHQGKGVERVDGPPGALTLSYPNPKAVAPLPTQDVELSGLAQNEDY